MKAFVYQRYGNADELRLAEVEAPILKPNEVLVRVKAASLNDWDVALLNGDFVNRMLNGFRRPKIQIIGSDIAGTVEAIGSNVTKFKRGDDVYGDLSGRWGGFAEFAAAAEDQLEMKPAEMTFAEAAAIPQAAMLAVQGLIDKGNIGSAQHILINGAGGGVGTFGIQLARLHDIEVTGVDNATKLDLLRDLGFDHIIDYEKEDFTRQGRRYDLILDTKTNRPILHYLRALKPGGKYITVGGSIPRLLQIAVLSPLISMLSSRRYSIVALKANKDLRLMNELFLAGKIKPVIDGPYSFEKIPEEVRRFKKGLHRGKIVFYF